MKARHLSISALLALALASAGGCREPAETGTETLPGEEQARRHAQALERRSQSDLDRAREIITTRDPVGARNLALLEPSEEALQRAGARRLRDGSTEVTLRDGTVVRLDSNEKLILQWAENLLADDVPETHAAVAAALRRIQARLELPDTDRVRVAASQVRDIRSARELNLALADENARLPDAPGGSGPP